VGCGTLALIWGTVAFAVVGGIWWFVSGHPPRELVWWYLSFIAFVLMSMADDYINAWRDEAKETAEKVKSLGEELKEVTERLDNLERKSRHRNW